MQHPSLRLKDCASLLLEPNTMSQPSPAPREPCRQMHAWDFPRSPWCPALPWIQVSPPQQPRTTCRPGDPLRRGSRAAQWRLPLESGTSRGASPEQAAARCHGGWCMVRARTSWSLHRQPGCLGSVCSSLPGHLHKHCMSTGTPHLGQLQRERCEHEDAPATRQACRAHPPRTPEAG